ncbi:MAG: alpha/beta hydrolase [Epsilonproteobacteria bacterium]|nr:MAG: alpha/beta hydrolase [Campylobacterota bacterium]
MALKTIQYKQHTFSISYEILNPASKIDIVFLHGWGANKELMKSAFGKNLKTFRHIYIDLPGFGKSTNDMKLSTEEYSEIIEIFLAEISANEKEIIVGHSFGGKVALFLNPKLLVLVASAGIYRTKSFFIMAKISLFKLFKFFGLNRFRALFLASDAVSLSQPMYETFKIVVNEDLSAQFESFEGKALLLWGRDDTATPVESAEYMVELIKDSHLIIYEGDHYFFMSETEDVSVEILKSYLKIKQS